MAELRIEGEKKLLDGLDRLSDRRARAELMDVIGSYGVSSTQERFLKEQSPDGEAWEKSTRALETGGRTLRDTNRLFQSLSHEADADSTAWGSNLVYAGIHQFGGEIRAKNVEKLAFNIGGKSIFVESVNMPARPFLGLDGDDQDEIQSIVGDWVTEALQ